MVLQSRVYSEFAHLYHIYSLFHTYKSRFWYYCQEFLWAYHHHILITKFLYIMCLQLRMALFFMILQQFVFDVFLNYRES